ncbi:MAG: hypothetical protein LBF19_04705 [Prevotellaceae bacterium]|jgi:hypothetical protein|nr:hypothetical protein [Prevotellaceae bacterium]
MKRKLKLLWKDPYLILIHFLFFAGLYEGIARYEEFTVEGGIKWGLVLLVFLWTMYRFWKGDGRK